MFERKWDDGLIIRELTLAEYEQLVMPAQRIVFRTPVFEAPETGTAEERLQVAQIRDEYAKRVIRLRIGAFLDGKFAGWHFGRQDSPTNFQMTNSGVLPEFRRRKIYERLLDSVLEWTKAQGYQSVTSGHHPSNIAVIIPKLKRNFWIAGTELTEKYGLIVRLSFFHSELARKVFEFRSGFIPLDHELQKALFPDFSPTTPFKG